MLVWNFFDFSKWPLERLESNAGLQPGSPRPLPSRSFLAGRVALKQLLKHFRLPEEIIPNERYGYLELKNCFGSIAHTENICVAALSSSPIGIDVEHSQRVVQRAIQKIASRREIENLASFNSKWKSKVKDEGLFLWTAKEAFSKALGLGLREGIKNIEVSLVGSSPHPAESHWLTPIKVQEPTISFHLIKDYLVCFCFEKKWGTEPSLIQELH